MYDTPLTRPTTVGGLLGNVFRGTGQVAQAGGGVPLQNYVLGPRVLDMIAARNRPARNRTTGATTMVAPPQGYQSILGMPSMLTPIAPDTPASPTSGLGLLQDVPPPMPRPSLLSDQLNQIERQSTPAPSLLGRIGGGIRSAGKELGGLFEGEEGQLRARELSKALMTGPTRVPVSFGQSLVEGLASGGEAVGAARAEQAKIDMALAKAAKSRGKGEASPASALREMYKAQNVISTIDDAYSRINPFTAGLGGAVLSSIPGTEARDVEGLLNTILANLGFDELKAMRAASPTGGALGQVSERENVLLQSAVRSLENSQSPEQIRKNLALVRKHYNRVLNLMKVEAYGVYDDKGNKIDIPSGEDGLKIVEAALAGKGYSIAGSSFDQGQMDDSEDQGQQAEVVRVTTEELNKELGE
jgi:hypothetical protein